MRQCGPGRLIVVLQCNVPVSCKMLIKFKFTLHNGSGTVLSAGDERRSRVEINPELHPNVSISYKGPWTPNVSEVLRVCVDLGVSFESG